jgi:hypothetical protein
MVTDGDWHFTRGKSGGGKSGDHDGVDPSVETGKIGRHCNEEPLRFLNHSWVHFTKSPTSSARMARSKSIRYNSSVASTSTSLERRSAYTAKTSSSFCRSIGLER